MKNHNNKWRPRLVGVLVIIVSFLFVVIAFKQIQLTYETADIVYLARLIEGGSEISQQTITSYAKLAPMLVEGKVCRSDVLKAGLSIILKNLDDQNLEVNYEAWELALESADAYLRHALSCLPTNGNFWLRLAMVRLTIGEQPDEIALLMNNAQRFAPSELSSIAGRLKVWNRVSPTTLSKTSASVLSDLLIAHKNIRYPELVIRDPSVALQPYIERASRLSEFPAQH